MMPDVAMKFSPQNFAAVSDLFERIAGIRYPTDKRGTVAMRLMRLAKEYGAQSIDEYVEAVLGECADPEQVTRIVDRLTTNETYFFREPAHFDFLSQAIAIHDRRRKFRVWSAASSSGEEAYSAAMVLADHLGVNGNWEIVGTDLSTAMVAAARQGLYGVDRIKGIDRERLQRYCRKGSGPYVGKMLVLRELRERVRFDVVNLMKPLDPELRLGRFDVIFLRNVMICFDENGRRMVVERVTRQLAEGGFLFIGHAESLTGITWDLAAVQPAVYERSG
jgi:chemotaxis protein methyltransferase CheR